MIRNFFRIFGRAEDESVPPEERGAVGTAGIVIAPTAPAFHPRNPLEEALVAAAHDPARRPAFNRLLLESTLYAMSPDLPASRGTTLPAAVTAPRLLQVKAPGGQGVPALYSTQARVFDAPGSGLGYFAAPGAQMLALVAGRGALLNPGLDYSVRWTPEDIAHLLGRPVARRREDDAQLLLGTPTETPEALLAALRGALAGEPDIAGAWLALAQWPGRDGLAWYLDVRTTLDRAAIEKRLEPVFRDMELGHGLDLVIVPPGGEGPGIRVVGQG